MSDEPPLLEMRAVTRRYDPGPTALAHVDLTLRRGESVAIIGRSGSGKSTLLNILGMLDVPTTGELWIGGEPVSAHTDRARSARRAADLGFIFQRSHLIGALSARENVMLGLRYADIDERDVGDLADESLRAVGLGGKLDAPARTLSGGEMQRVAIARTLARPASVWLADEPTGNLDSARSAEIVDLLIQAAAARDACLVLVTHELDIAEKMARVITLHDGVVVSDTRGHRATQSDLAITGTGPASTAGARRDRPDTATESVPALRLLATGRAGHRIGRRAARTARFVLQAIAAHPKRAGSGILAVALAVALTLTALGLAQSASAQVTSMFDAQRASQVTARISVDPEHPPRWPLRIDHVQQYAGVDAVEYWHERDGIPMSNGELTSDTASVVETDSAPAKATGGQINWAAGHTAALGNDEVILGDTLATRLGVHLVDLQPEIVVGGHLVRVIGILTDSRVGTAGGTAFLLTGTLEDLGPAASASIYAVTAPGAARGLAERLPGLLDPYGTTTLRIDPVLTADAFRGSLEGRVATSLTLMAGLAGLAGLIAVVFVNILGVNSRTAEFGVRRAFGARRRELVTLVLTETTLLGSLGAILGLAIGFTTIMTVTALARWQPVFDVRLLAIPLAGALLLGTIAGLAPAILAGRVQPADAVRSE